MMRQVLQGCNVSKQQGLSIPLAIFVLVVLSLIGVAMINILDRGQESIAREVLSLRALAAAESGAENGLLAVLEGGASCAGLALSLTWTTTGLASCSAAVSCDLVVANAEDYYTIRSEGQCGGTNGAFRIIEVQAHQ